MKKWLLPAAGVAAVVVAIVGTLALAGAFDGDDGDPGRDGDDSVAESDGDADIDPALGICVEGTVDCVDTPLGTDDSSGDAAGGTCPVGTMDCNDTPADQFFGSEPPPFGSPDCTSDQGRCQEAMIALVSEDLAARTGTEVVLVSSEHVNWPDASLGNPQPDHLYPQVITPGFKIVLAAGGDTYEYHTDTGGAFTLLE
jgi:hypothetical protein